VVSKYRFDLYEIHWDRKLNVRSHNTSYYLTEVVAKAGLTVVLEYQY